jgi:hypothetical protein
VYPGSWGSRTLRRRGGAKPGFHSAGVA